MTEPMWMLRSEIFDEIAGHELVEFRCVGLPYDPGTSVRMWREG